MTMPKNVLATFTNLALLGLICVQCWTSPVCLAQNEKASINSSIANDGTGRIIVEARGELPKAAVIYTAKSQATAKVIAQRIDQTVHLTIKVIQGNAETVSLGISGSGQVTAVVGEQIESWSVRQVGTDRFLDLHLKEGATSANPLVSIRSAKLKLPVAIDLTHLTPGDAVGFDSTVSIEYESGVEGNVAEVTGFAPLGTKKNANRFQTSTGGQVKLSLKRSGASPDPVELVDTTLKGKVHDNGKSIQFQLHGTVQVSEPNAEITILSGNAAAINVPADANYRLQLAIENKRPVYRLVFTKRVNSRYRLILLQHSPRRAAIPAALTLPSERARSSH